MGTTRTKRQFRPVQTILKRWSLRRYGPDEMMWEERQELTDYEAQRQASHLRRSNGHLVDGEAWGVFRR